MYSDGRNRKPSTIQIEIKTHYNSGRKDNIAQSRQITQSGRN